MGDKKVLNEEELEKIAGGTENGWQWHSKCCNKSIEIVWLSGEASRFAVKCTGCGKILEESEIYFEE